MRVILLRHGETDHNVERRIQGHKDVPLNSRGQEQARDVARLLEEKMEIDAVYSSDLLRAYQTAEAVANGKRPLYAVPELRERYMGELEGMLHSEALTKRKREGKQSLLDYGENGNDVTNRLVKAYRNIVKDAAEHGYQTVVIVSHGSALYNLFKAMPHRKIAGFATPEIKSAYYKHPKLGNCCVTIVGDGMFTHYAEQWTESIVRERDLV